jgi:hypothetical protein
MERTETRINGKQWCKIEIRLTDTDRGPRLSIFGVEGRILTRAQAKREALEGWENYFGEDSAALGDMCKRYGVRSVKGAADKVVEIDGEFHGVDVDREEGNKIFTVDTCDRESLKKYFPEYAKYLPYHLNDMRPSVDGSSWEYEALPADVIAWAQGK